MRSSERTQKVRRDLFGSSANTIKVFQKVTPADPKKIVYGKPDKGLSGSGGQIGFRIFTSSVGLDKELESLNHLKPAQSRYRMSDQMLVVLASLVSGESRIMGIESLATDPVFSHLAGRVSSLDTFYRDMERFEANALVRLHSVLGEQTIAMLKADPAEIVYLDVDTTVMTAHGDFEGAAIGYNPKYRGHESYHPILIRVEQTNTVIAAALRPGNTGLGMEDAEIILLAIERVRKALPKAVIIVRIDSGGDCAELLNAIHNAQAFFLVKRKICEQNIELCLPDSESQWTAKDMGVDEPLTEVAEIIGLYRKKWLALSLESTRVVAMRSIIRSGGKQVSFLDGKEAKLQMYNTNLPADLWTPEEIVDCYDLRAGIEPLIAELKTDLGIDQFSSRLFNANHAMLLLKLLAHSLLHRMAKTHFTKTIRNWKTAWLRRLLILIPCLLRTHGRKIIVRFAPRPVISPMIC